MSRFRVLVKKTANVLTWDFEAENERKALEKAQELVSALSANPVYGSHRNGAFVEISIDEGGEAVYEVTKKENGEYNVDSSSYFVEPSMEARKVLQYLSDQGIHDEIIAEVKRTLIPGEEV